MGPERGMQDGGGGKSGPLVSPQNRVHFKNKQQNRVLGKRQMSTMFDDVNAGRGGYSR